MRESAFREEEEKKLPPDVRKAYELMSNSERSDFLRMDPTAQAAIARLTELRRGTSTTDAAGGPKLASTDRDLLGAVLGVPGVDVDALFGDDGAAAIADAIRAYKADQIKLTELTVALKDALVSGDVYPDGANAKALSALGVTRLSDAEIAGLGLDPKRFVSDSGFYSALYYDKNDKSYILGARGTEMEMPAVLKDGKTNGLQALGFSERQYAEAVALADHVYPKLNGNVLFTGHSLGGGLASAMALSVKGGRAITFNAAGISEGTIALHHLDTTDAESRVTAYFVRGEILHSAQGFIPLDLAAGLGLSLPVNASKALLWVLGVEENPSFGKAYVPEAIGRQVELSPVHISSGNDGPMPAAPISGLNIVPNTGALHGINYVLGALRYDIQQIMNKY